MVILFYMLRRSFSWIPAFAGMTSLILLLTLSGCSSMKAKQAAEAKINNPNIKFLDPKSGQEEVNIWRGLHREFKLEHYTNKSEVQEQINWYVAHPDFLIRSTTRGNPFIYYILEQLKQRQLPAELALLPIVESAYNPYAYSRSGASGIWQFLPGTADVYSVKRNWWYDGRRDVLAATNAALDYLTYLNQYFSGDWLLAIAAYNGGEGSIRRAVKQNSDQNLPTDFWSLSLRDETQKYVPKLLALAAILNNQRKYPIEWPNTPEKTFLTSIKVNSQIDLTEAATMADISMTEFYQLNPGFNRSASDPNNYSEIVIPLDKVERFKAAMADQLAQNTIQYKTYSVKPREGLQKIAQRFHTTLKELRELNKLVTDHLYPGQALLVPMGEILIAPKETVRNYLMKPGQEGYHENIGKIHRVLAGETLFEIARKYHIGYKQLMQWNNLTVDSVLHVDQRLTINAMA
jgi:membrane-bound lytic murein transglycosylase D